MCMALEKVVKKILFSCLLLTILGSCTKDLFTEDPYELYRVGVKRNISADANLPNADKAYMDYNDALKVKWESGDQLNVNGMNISEAGIIGGTYANFAGTVYGMPSHNEVSKEVYWAVYPTTLAGAYSGSIPAEFQETSLTVSLPIVQTYNATRNVLQGYNAMAGYAKVVPGNHIHFYMKNLCTVFRFNLTAASSATNTHASRLEFHTSSARLSGDFSVDTNGVLTAKPEAISSHTVYLTDGTNGYIDIAGGAVVYVVLPAISTGSLTMKIFNTDERCTTKSVASVTTVQNHLYTTTFTDIDFDEISPVLYSISPTHKVSFAPGNLQWSYTNGGSTPTSHAVADGGTKTGTWRFAEHQWNFVGNTTIGNVYGVNGVANAKCSNTKHGHTYNGWLDLFGYGTSAWNSGTYSYDPGSKSGIDTNYWPGLNYTNNLTGAYAYADWGIYNEIYNPKTGVTDPAGTWRTPTNDEWVYLISARSTPSGMRFAKAIVGDVNGLLVFPDNWDPSVYTINSVNVGTVDYTVNVISFADFQLLDDKGVVFLPAGGNRTASNVNETNQNGSYWSSTSYNRDRAYGLYFGWDSKYGGLLVGPGLTHGRSHGRCVRLVHDDI